MTTRPTFEHRHYVKLANIIAEMGFAYRATGNEAAHTEIAERFADGLRGTNPNFNRDHFLAAARGQPSNGRDKVR